MRKGARKAFETQVNSEIPGRKLRTEPRAGSRREQVRDQGGDSAGSGTLWEFEQQCGTGNSRVATMGEEKRQNTLLLECDLEAAASTPGPGEWVHGMVHIQQDRVSSTKP